MPQQTSTALLRGGLNLVTPAIAIPPGQATAALNYEPDVAGYSRLVGYERFDGRPAPSSGADASEIAALRAAIEAVPGDGPVRGVWPYDGSLWAFRDTLSGEGAMYESSAAGWVQQSFGHTIDFNTGTAEFLEGETLTGGTSTATATIERVVLRSGAYADGDAAGYLVVSDVDGTFEAETATSSSGSATITGAVPVSLIASGTYEFANHNFYGAAKRPRMYFANGVGTAFEWDGEVLAPIRTGTAEGSLDTVVLVLERGGGGIFARNGDRIVMRGEFDRPNYIGQFRNHLFLAFEAGSIIHSGVGEPLDYRTISGAGEISFGETITGFVPSLSAALVVMGRNRIEYIAGNDSDDFQMLPISSTAGAFQRTAKAAGESPIYLDDAGIRKLSSTSAFGDFRMGTLSQAVEPLFRAKRKAGVSAKTSLVVRAKDQYRLFFDDRTGLIVYMGRKTAEVMPFLYPFDIFCAFSGELAENEGERHFAGAEDGFVYELDAGTSFDGAEVQAYIRLPWNSVGAPSVNKRFHKATVEMDSEDDIQIGVVFHVDYGIPGNVGGSQVDHDVDAGSQASMPIDYYENIDWTQPAQGVLEAHIDGIGRNIAVTLITEHTAELPHTLSALTINFSPRGLRK